MSIDWGSGTDEDNDGVFNNQLISTQSEENTLKIQLQQSFKCGVPDEVVQALHRTNGLLWGELINKSRNAMIQRKSKVMSDTDVAEAFRDMSRPRHVDLVQRCVGDGMMIAGAVLIPLWDKSCILTIAGILIVAAGLYIREFTKPK